MIRVYLYFFIDNLYIKIKTLRFGEFCFYSELTLSASCKYIIHKTKKNEETKNIIICIYRR